MKNNRSILWLIGAVILGLVLSRESHALQKSNEKFLLVKQGGLHINVSVDVTGSADIPAETTAVSNSFNIFPHIFVSFGVTRASLSVFGADAGKPRVIFDIPIPSLVITDEPARSSPFEFTKSYNEAFYADSVVRAKKAKESQYLYYKNILEQQILTTKPDILRLITSPSGTPCSDISGKIQHAASHACNELQYLDLVITDGVENCLPSIKTIPDPGERIGLVIILVPENPNTSGASPIASKRSWEQFEIRKAELQKAVPWALIIPFDTENLIEALKAAINR